MSNSSSGVSPAEIWAAAQRVQVPAAAKIQEATLGVAVDLWLTKIAGRVTTPHKRARLLRAVERGDAPEAKEIQLTHTALLRAIGWDVRPAAAAAAEAGASWTEIGEILGVSRQAATKRIQRYLDERAAGADRPGKNGWSPR